MLCILVIAVEKEIVNILSSLGENEDYNGKYLLITLCLKDRCRSEGLDPKPQGLRTAVW